MDGLNLGKYFNKNLFNNFYIRYYVDTKDSTMNLYLYNPYKPLSVIQEIIIT